MTIRRAALLVLGVASVLPAAGADWTGPEYRASTVCARAGLAGSAVLVIHVTDAMEGNPIAGADITTANSGAPKRLTHSDGAGRAAVKDLYEGPVDVEVTMDGFVSARATVQIRSRCVTALTVPLEIGSLGVD
jgi:hypothetical protein